MTAEIITIGDEILIGQIVDTNSAWIAQHFNQIGLKIAQITSIADVEDKIRITVEKSLANADVVITTGGLGPTNDDRTKQVLCNIFGGKMVLHDKTLSQIEEMFQRRGLPLTESNRRQAEVPSSCEVLLNTAGTAPGMLFRKNKKVLIALPGVPFEMKHIMETSALPLLAKFVDDGVFIKHEVVQVFGIAESFLSDKLQDFERSMPKNIGLAYLPSPVGIKLRLSGTSRDKQLLDGQMNQCVDRIRDEISDYIFGYGETSLPIVTGELLKKFGKTVSTAESCTGGRVANLITSIPGASAYYVGSVVSYSNLVKHNVLGVQDEAFEQFGAVSTKVVAQMAAGVRRLMGTDYSIAISGIAGPDGGTADKPVGLVYVAVSSEKQSVIEQFNFGILRDVNIERAAYSALNMLRLLLVRENS